jgi:two-component system sensor histidine kinase PhoQ
MRQDSRPDSTGPARAPARRPVSLRARLLLLAVVVLAVSLSLVGLALDAAFTRSSEADLGNQMETWVYLVLGATEVTESGAIQVQNDLGDPRLSQPASGIYVHVHGEVEDWNSPSSLGLDLPELPLVPPGENAFRTPETGDGYYIYQYGVAWELADASVLPFTISVRVEADKLGHQIRSFRRGLWRSLGGAGLILALAQFAFFALGMRPLRRIASDVAAIETGEKERLAGPYPKELEPLTRNVDRLLTTEKANQARYRSALDSLAHSLKTPLAVIRAGLAKSDRPGDAAMENAVHEMQHLITSRLQRAAASTRRTMATPVPVRAQVQRLLDSLRKVYSHKLKTVDVIIPGNLVFYGEKRDLLELMGNLLDNAFKYGEGKVRVKAGAIEAGADRAGVWMTVENDGQPIPDDRKEQLLQRGVRGDQRVEGHGLGLTIVMELLTAYGGKINIKESDLGGALIEMRIPPG